MSISMRNRVFGLFFFLVLICLLLVLITKPPVRLDTWNVNEILRYPLRNWLTWSGALACEFLSSSFGSEAVADDTSKNNWCTPNRSKLLEIYKAIFTALFLVGSWIIITGYRYFCLDFPCSCLEVVPKVSYLFCCNDSTVFPAEGGWNTLPVVHCQVTLFVVSFFFQSRSVYWFWRTIFSSSSASTFS